MEILPTMQEAPNFTPLPPSITDPVSNQKESFLSKFKFNMLTVIIIVAVLFIISLVAYFLTRTPESVPTSNTGTSQTADQSVPPAQPTAVKEAGASAGNTEMASSEGDVSDITVSEFDTELQDIQADVDKL